MTVDQRDELSEAPADMLHPHPSLGLSPLSMSCSQLWSQLYSCLTKFVENSDSLEGPWDSSPNKLNLKSNMWAWFQLITKISSNI